MFGVLVCQCILLVYFLIDPCTKSCSLLSFIHHLIVVDPRGGVWEEWCHTLLDLSNITTPAVNVAVPTRTITRTNSPPKQDTLVATCPVLSLALTLMYFSTNVMFRTLHSNPTIYLSTWLPSGDVRVHIEVFQALTVGVDRVPGQQKCVYNSFVPLVFCIYC